MSNICPVCGKRYGQRPAISRRDNKTPICTLCGVKEAIQGLPQTEQDEIIATVEESLKC